MENQLTELKPEIIQELEEKAQILSAKYGCKVHIYATLDPKDGEVVVGFLKEPNYIQKLMAMDKLASTGIFMAGEEMRESLTLKEESNPKTYLEGSEYDAFRLGMVSTCVTIIEVSANQFKKKSN